MSIRALLNAVDRKLISAGSALAFLAVALGAFGTHGLRDRISADNLQIWETGVRYHLIHAVAIVLCGVIAGSLPAKFVARAGWLFVAGIAIFSGSLYILAVTNIRWMGAITPFGGLCFLVAWAILAWCASKGN